VRNKPKEQQLRKNATASHRSLYVTIISYGTSQNQLSKESLIKFATNISAENKTDKRIYGTICYSQKIDNSGKVLAATILPYHGVRKEKENKPDSEGKPAHRKT